MTEPRRWRMARFGTAEARAEFVEHARSIGLEGVEIEPSGDDLRVRFRAPARFEIGLACMVEAHGGKVLPSAEQPESEPETRRVAAAR